MAANSFNILISTQNLSDPGVVSTPTFSGGSWYAGAPLTNLQNRYLANVARSTDCTPASTQFTCDLMGTRAVQVVVIPKHNLSTASTVTINLYDRNNTLVSTNTVTPFPVIYPWGTLPWGDPHWLTGTITYEEWLEQEYPTPVLLILPASVLARYVQVLISDPYNPVGYVQLSRLFVCAGWQPSLNFTYSSSIQVIDGTVATKTIGGAINYDQRPTFRRFNINLDLVGKNEAFVNLLDTEIRQGITGQVFVCLDPTDVVNISRNSGIFTRSTLNPLPFAAPNYMSKSLVFDEVIA